MKSSRAVFHALAYISTLFIFFLIISISSIGSNHFVPFRSHKSAKVTLVSGLYQLSMEGEYEECSTSHSQYIAITEWSLHFAEVLILADDLSVCAAAMQIGKMTDGNIKCHQHACMHPEYRRPVVSCLLLNAAKLASNDYVLFSNSDLAYYNVIPAISIARGVFKQNFALVGRRRDIDFQGQCKSMDKGSFMLQDILKAPGELHDPFGIDYIIVPRNLIGGIIKGMPDFLIGLWKWDNWLVDTVIKKGLNLVDATNLLHAIHLQNTKAGHRARKGWGHNKDLYSKFYNLGPDEHLLSDPFPVGLGTIEFAPFYIKDGAIFRRWCYFDVGKEFQPCRNQPRREDISTQPTYSLLVR